MRGLMAPVCDKCVKAESGGAAGVATVHRVPIPVTATGVVSVHAKTIFRADPENLFKGLETAELIHAWWLRKDESLVVEVHKPTRASNLLTRPLAKPKTMRIPVRIISEEAHMGTSTPPTRLHTNLQNFQRRKRNFWVEKVPGFCDGKTGSDRLEVPRESVARIERVSKNVIMVHLKNGEFVKLEYLGAT
jgi:hypothetical protein